jgi:hypothetical protein
MLCEGRNEGRNEDTARKPVVASFLAGVKEVLCNWTRLGKKIQKNSKKKDPKFVPDMCAFHGEEDALFRVFLSDSGVTMF